MADLPFLIYEIDHEQLEQLREIAIRTFDETFSSTNSKENMEHYFARSFNLERLENEMKVPDSRFWFINYGQELAGYLKVNTAEAQTELKETDGLEVERIYVLKKYHGTGVGSELMEHAKKYAKKLGKKYIWLGVHEENHRALKFYRKYGFEEFSDHVFMMGKQPQRDILMRMELKG
ncbi:MAG: GNAT family N-acetyltransferase [Bacteroidales bacterium]|nr:GNAT family N-acetyltransferase [Bacteroidales bacterium]